MPKHDVHVNVPEGTEEKNQYLSVLYAILEGASKALDISRDDISGCVTENQELVLFDDTAGGSGFVKHIFLNFDKVLREARNKVSGICGCTPETSCYGCLRNYSNQFFHDQISRGMAYDYINWLIESENIVATEPPKQPKEVKERTKEEIGSKTFEFDPPDSSTYPDILSQFETLRDSADDDSIKTGFDRLAKAVGSDRYEKPVSEEKLPAKEKDVWPELFWGKSKVALFTPDEIKQYNILKKYDWYCYIVDENIDAELVLSHIKEE